MRLQIPPAIPYAIGALLIILGALRIKYLGAPRARLRAGSENQGNPSTPMQDDVSARGPENDHENEESSEREVRGPEQRRHIRWGVIWILMGLFLVISTLLQVHRQGGA